MTVDPHLRRAGLVLLAAMVLLLLTLPLTLPASLRTRAAEALSERFDGSVELDNLRVSVFPRLRVIADSVVVRHKGRTDVPPLITVRSVSADAGLIGLLFRPIRLRYVHLDGLEINIPPGDEDEAPDGPGDEGDAGKSRAGSQGDGPGRDRSPLVVDRLLSERATVRILRRKPGARPREFEIERLTMDDTGADEPWAFAATLTNPTPPGRIRTAGTFGPWNADRPERTALAANYEFRDADLGHFKGIRGILQSTGRFSGVLERILVDGTTDVPDFALADVGHPVHLRTRFHAIVDGTNGNTWLQPVDAVLRNTSIHADGGVVEQEGEDGRTVSLDIVMDDARIEDVLALATKASPPAMVGALKLRAKFELPPGESDPRLRMRLSRGVFELDAARFRGGGVQAKVNELSQKARGDDDGGAPEEVASDFRGTFEMADGRIHFSKVTFAVPGARVELTGDYAIAAEALDFRGNVRLEAKLSELTTGAKSFLLKLVEPLFRRDNVTIVPITIGGTVDQPKFGLDVKRAFTPG